MVLVGSGRDKQTAVSVAQAARPIFANFAAVARSTCGCTLDNDNPPERKHPTMTVEVGQPIPAVALPGPPAVRKVRVGVLERK